MAYMMRASLCLLALTVARGAEGEEAVRCLVAEDGAESCEDSAMLQVHRTGEAALASDKQKAGMKDPVEIKTAVFSSSQDACMACTTFDIPSADKCYSYGCTEEICGTTDGYMYVAYPTRPDFNVDFEECPSESELPESFSTATDACVACKAHNLDEQLECYEYPCVEEFCNTTSGYMYVAYDKEPDFVEEWSQCQFLAKPTTAPTPAPTMPDAVGESIADPTPAPTKSSPQLPCSLEPAAGCTGNPAETCFYDPTCSETPPAQGGLGCNAGGVDQNCRFCGFAHFPACP